MNRRTSSSFSSSTSPSTSSSTSTSPTTISITYDGLTLTLDSEGRVYEPAEDSFLLARASAGAIGAGECVLEIGTGTGLIALVLARMGAKVLATDINPHAIALAQKNIEENRASFASGGAVQFCCGDLFGVLDEGERFDAIVFNPPYLPTRPEDLVDGGGWFDIAVAGGKDGLCVTRRFINGLSCHLAPDGCAYFVFSSHADEEALGDILADAGLVATDIARERFFFETLTVYRVS